MLLLSKENSTYAMKKVISITSEMATQGFLYRIKSLAKSNQIDSALLKCFLVIGLYNSHGEGFDMEVVRRCSRSCRGKS